VYKGADHMPIDKDPDNESDEWIGTYISTSADKGERNNAAKCLFLKHKNKVFNQIRRKIPHGDAQNDISQEVWMNILNVDRLKNKYKPQGKFGAYLYQYTEWKISDFIKKNSSSYSDVELKNDEHELVDPVPSYEDGIDARKFVVDVIPELSAAIRLVYLMEHYEILFPSKPDIHDIAHLNGVKVKDASMILSLCTQLASSEMTEVDRCIWVLSDYENIVPKSVKRNVGGYKADLAKIIGISYSSYRVRLARANKSVKQKLENLMSVQGVIA